MDVAADGNGGERTHAEAATGAEVHAAAEARQVEALGRRGLAVTARIRDGLAAHRDTGAVTDPTGQALGRRECVTQLDPQVDTGGAARDVVVDVAAGFAATLGVQVI